MADYKNVDYANRDLERRPLSPRERMRKPWQVAEAEARQAALRAVAQRNNEEALADLPPDVRKKNEEEDRAFREEFHAWAQTLPAEDLRRIQKALVIAPGAGSVMSYVDDKGLTGGPLFPGQILGSFSLDPEWEGLADPGRARVNDPEDFGKYNPYLQAVRDAEPDTE